MDAEDSARMRDLMAGSRTLLAWIRTAVSFTGLGCAPYLRTVELEQGPPEAPAPPHWPTVTAAGCCGLSCVLLAVYLAVG